MDITWSWIRAGKWLLGKVDGAPRYTLKRSFWGWWRAYYQPHGVDAWDVFRYRLVDRWPGRPVRFSDLEAAMAACELHALRMELLRAHDVALR